MSISETIDEKYRLHVDDLSGRDRQLIVSNVSYQGIEEMRPVLHFEGLTKRLVLTRDQGFEMVRLTHTPVPSDWIGQTVLLSPAPMGGEPAIVIESASRNTRRLFLARRLPHGGSSHLLLAIAILAALLIAIWLLAGQWSALQTLVQPWLQ